MWRVTDFGSKYLLHIIINIKKGDTVVCENMGPGGIELSEMKPHIERQILCSKYHLYVESEKEKQVKLRN